MDTAKPELRKSCKEALAGNRESANGLKLRYITPTEPGIVEYSEADVKPTVEKWQNSLLGAVIGANPTFYAMEQFILVRWKKIGIPKIFKKDNDIFLLKFRTRQEMENALAEGPCFFAGKYPLVLRQWTPGPKLDRTSLDTLNVWVTLPDLDLQF